jgi:hypothetical protein
MRSWGLAAVGLVVLSVSCSESLSDSGGARPSAGSSGKAGAMPGETGGVGGSDVGAAESSAGDASSGGFGGFHDACTDGDYNFGNNGEGGADYGSASALAELVGTWQFVDVPGDAYVWTINADGTGSYAEHVGKTKPPLPNTCTGTVHLNNVVLVLDVAECTGDLPDNNRINVAYQRDAVAAPEVLNIAPPDCGALSYDPFERQ